MMSGSGQSPMKDLKAIPSKGSQSVHKTASILLSVQQNEDGWMQNVNFKVHRTVCLPDVHM